MQHLFRYILFMLFASPTICTAQGDAALLRQLTVADGLPQGYVSAVVQDSHGFIWIGTLDGLARYDGRKFKASYYEPDNKNGLSSGIIYHLWIDSKERLWILYQSGHIDIFDTRTEKITHLTTKDGFTDMVGKVRSGNTFVEDHTGQFWLLTLKGDLYVIDKNITKLLFKPQDSAALGIAIDGKNILLSTQTALIYLSTGGSIIEKVIIPFPTEAKMDEHKFARDNSAIKRNNGELVFIGYEQIILFNPKSRKYKRLSLPTHDNGYFQSSPKVIDRQGNIYFDHDGTGIWKLDTADNFGLWHPSETGVKSLFIDGSGVLWAGTTGWGIKQFDLRIHHLQSRPYQKDFLHDILKHSGESKTGSDRIFENPINSYFWRWIRSGHGEVYVAHSAIFNPITNIFFIDEKGKRNTSSWHIIGNSKNTAPISAFAESRHGQLWAIGHDMNLYELDPAKQTLSYRYHVPFNAGDPFSDEVNGLVADGNNFWIGSMKALVHYNSVSGKIECYLTKMRVLSIFDDPADNDVLWVGTTYGGLVKFNKKTKKYKNFTVRDGLPNNAVYAILYDDNGNIWCSTNKGIFSFGIEDNKIRRYTIQGSTSLIEFNRHHCFKFSNGRLAFGGSDAYVLFDPKKVSTDNYMPKTIITSVYINNIEIKGSEMKRIFNGNINDIGLIDLPYDKNFLSFEFSATEYNMPEKLQYRYMMKGLDKNWILAGNDNSAAYTTIPPGSYELLINASNTTGAWSSSIRRIKVIIAPPFWRTWWFITAIVSVILLLLYLLLRRKITMTRKRDQQLLSFEREAMQLEARALRSQMNPHFIFNCLNSIKSLIHTGDKKEAILYLTTFAELLRNQLNNSLLEITLAEELETCELYLELETLRFGEKLKYNFNIDPSVDCRSVRIPALLIQPFVENAIIHGLLPLPNGGKIIVSVSMENEKVLCSIDDNGAGRSNQVKAASHDSKGIKLVKGRLELFNSINQRDTEIQIIDKFNLNNAPAGTLVIITLPL